jgi:small subunit ribosomal protein S2
MINDINAIREAKKLGVPVIALVDTNGDPGLVDYPIPCNDDATKTINLILDYIKEAITAGKQKAEKAKTEKTDKADKPEAAPEQKAEEK